MIRVPNLQDEWRGYLAEWHLDESDWACDCDDNMLDWMFCRESRDYAWKKVQELFREAVLT